MNASEIMTPNPETVDIGSPLREALAMLMELEIRHLPVTFDGDLVGIVSDRDLRQYMPALCGMKGDPSDDLRALDAPVRSIMHGKPLCVEDCAEISEVIDIMIEEKVGALPVVNSKSGKLTGIISYIDVLKAAQNFL